MRLYPAIDILGGNAVRLVRGDFDAKKVYDEDPLSAARGWVAAGADYLHVVDLDGAKAGQPVNLEQLRRIALDAGVPVQYGGGLRTARAVADALAAGAARVILGTAAFADPELLREVLDAHGPERVLVGVDVRDGHVATHGWLQSTDIQARDAFAELQRHGARDFRVHQHRPRRHARRRQPRRGGVGGARGGGGQRDLLGWHRQRSRTSQALASLRTELALEALDGVIVGTALYEGRFTVAEAKAALAS